jgi:hypothetical protein
MVLFHRIEYGEAIYNILRNLVDNEVYYVSGVTDKDDREEYKKNMDKTEDSIFYTFSFLDKQIKFIEDYKITLSDGTIKNAKDIKENDDIDDNFLENYIKINKL